MTEKTDKQAVLEWKLRVSPRARYARLLIKPYGGLEVVIPPRFPRAQIPSLVARHSLPRQLTLAFDNSTTRVLYASESLAYNYDLFGGQSIEHILIEGDTQQQQISELRAWIRHRAKTLLPPLLQKMARQTGLEYRRVTIRSQKTRWGSCSSRGQISLNDQLLFLPAPTVEYLMIHELCHTRHLNHSRDYWRLVESLSPDYRSHEKLLGRSRDLVPEWFLMDLYR
jgi:predicted metal-dependent hydrolase